MPRKRNSNVRSAVNAKTAKTKQSGPKAGSKPSKESRKVRVPRQLVETLCSMNDPFCSHAQSAQWHTGARVRTTTLSQHLLLNVPTNSNGVAGLLFCPGWTYFASLNTSTGTACSFTTLGGAATGSTPAFVRITSAGLVVRSTFPKLTASGSVRIRSFNITDGATLGVIEPTTFFCAEYTDIALSDCKEVAIKSQVLDASRAPRLLPPTITNPTANVADWVSPGFSPILVAVTGGPVSTNVVEVEIFINYEVTYDDSNPLALTSRATPPVNPIFDAVKDTVASSVVTIAKNGVSSFSNMVIGKASQALAAYLGGPAGAGAYAMIRNLD